MGSIVGRAAPIWRPIVVWAVPQGGSRVGSA
jgi:hypothetical protein